MLIGNVLRKVRQEKDLTIRELAELTGLSIGFISNLERDINSPTIGSLAKICQALDTNIVNLLQSNSQPEKNIARKEERNIIYSSKESKTTYELLFPQTKNLRPVIVTTEPGGNYGEMPLGHKGDEFCIILEGTLEITLDDETHILHEGDSIYINAFVPHKYRNAGKEKCVSLWVSQGSNEPLD